MRAAPSSSEYSECTWRWTKPSLRSVMCGARNSSRKVIHSARCAVDNYTDVIRAEAQPTPGLGRRQGCRSRAAASARSRSAGSGFLELDRAPPVIGWIERETPRVQEGPLEAERGRVGRLRPRRLDRRGSGDRSPAGAPGSGASGRSAAPPRAGSHAVEALPNLEGGLGRAALAAIDDDALGAAPERRVDGEGVVLDPAAHQREVAPVDVVTPHHRRERAVRLVGLRDDHEPRRAGVEAVHDAGTQLAARRSTAACPCRAAGSRACRCGAVPSGG